MSKQSTAARICATSFHDSAVRAAPVDMGDKLEDLPPELEQKLDAMGLLEPVKGTAVA